VADERTGLPALAVHHAREAARVSPTPRAPAVTPAEPPAPAPPHVATIPLPAPAALVVGVGTPIPAHRPVRPRDEPEVYPEEGDTVTHFQFGDCMVVGSDGDRIRLRQDGKDGRVREVALTMLKIGPPTPTADGHRHFMLLRKN
jgi:hypothetical protein